MKPAGVMMLLAPALCCIPATTALDLMALSRCVLPGEAQDYCRACTINRSLCSLVYFPHCGSDGITYGNKCLFCRAFLKKYPSLTLLHFRKC